MLESSVTSEQEAAKQGNQQTGSGDKMPPTSHTLIDLIIAMSIYLPRSSFAGLFGLAAAVLNSDTPDQQLIKKAYKLIPRLASTKTGQAALLERSSELQSLILNTADKTPASARRDRMLAIHELITYLPTSDLHFIPSVLSEVVLGCKESNEKARTASFELLMHLAKRTMDTERNPPGTKIRNSLVSHMPDNAPDAPATIEEFFTMVSAGLAGSSPHMVAASVTALSRLFFEFNAEMQPALRVDLVQTVELFLTSNNREIVRSVLGFVKVAVVVLPDDVLRPRLDTLVPNLMAWNKEHKGRLRSKVKGIVDRLIRRFGAPLLEQLVGENDRKLVVNIRKQRERSKKKKTGAAGGDEESEDEDGAAHPGKSYSNAFDKTVYDSDSDGSDVDDDASEIDIDEEGTARASKGKKAGGGKSRKQNEQYIRELSPEDNPLDLLAPNALANISTTKPSVRFLDTGKKKRSAKVDQDGKLVLGGDADHDITMSGALNPNADGAANPDAGTNAYLAAVSGPDAGRRGQKGKLKFSQKSKAADGDEDRMDVDGDDTGPVSGEEFHAAKKAQTSRRGLGASKSHGPSAPGGGKVQKRRNEHPHARGRGGGRGGKRH